MTCVLEQWAYRADLASTEIVFPDGCRDLIVVRPLKGAGFCFVSDLQAKPRRVEIQQGTEIVGFRLKPGVCVDEVRLTGRLRDGDGDPVQAGGLIDEHCRLPGDLDEAVRCLSQEVTSVAEAARSVGVSRRTLQRLFRGNGLHPPEFWLLLARARRAASWIAPGETLANVALAAGYADQAHMTREFRRWFGLSPATLRRTPRLHHLLCQPGLGTPATGEHISIR